MSTISPPQQPPQPTAPTPTPTPTPDPTDTDCLACRLVGGAIMTGFGAQLVYEARKHARTRRAAGAVRTPLGAVAMGSLGVGMFLVGLHRWFAPYLTAQSRAQRAR